MARVSYDFDRVEKKKGKKNIYIRLALIFIVVGAITTLALYWLIPKSDADSSSETKTPPVETQSTPAQADEEQEAEPETSLPENAESAGDESDEEAKLPEPIAPPEDATLVPEKGKPWVGDPAVDAPEIPADGAKGFDSELLEGEKSLETKNYQVAIDIALKALKSTQMVPYSAEWRRAGAILTGANLALFKSRSAIEKASVFHTVKPGESYSRLATKYKVTIDAIKYYNKVASNDNKLLVGKKLLIYPGPWKIVIYKNSRLLELYNRDRLYAFFDIGIGRLGKTPAAKFVISSKLKNPDWYAPGGGVVKYGEPDNPLGNYFLKLAPSGSPDRPLLGYGIHGTQDETDITRSLSNGCIRMRDADVAMLYTIVPAGTPVEIVE
ncbi:MAG: L,D-transpeptidase family protein [Victivallales bacterium]|jgi:lipoprotein-anchoring transpeptidase ErfK/SrfK|nr:L,D-transpeptidase family protein [Victivallales bacterium]